MGFIVLLLDHRFSVPTPACQMYLCTKRIQEMNKTQRGDQDTDGGNKQPRNIFHSTLGWLLQCVCVCCVCVVGGFQ